MGLCIFMTELLQWARQKGGLPDGFPLAALRRSVLGDVMWNDINGFAGRTVPIAGRQLTVDRLVPAPRASGFRIA
jgi:hypothetical protein